MLSVIAALNSAHKKQSTWIYYGNKFAFMSWLGLFFSMLTDLPPFEDDMLYHCFFFLKTTPFILPVFNTAKDIFLNNGKDIKLLIQSDFSLE